MINKHKSFIPVAKQRAIRNTIQYQVFMEDICAVFGAESEQIKMFERMMNGEDRDKVCGLNQGAKV